MGTQREPGYYRVQNVNLNWDIAFLDRFEGWKRMDGKKCDESDFKQISSRIDPNPSQEKTEVKLPPIICLCGSTKFKDEYLAEQKRLTLEGKIVLSVGLFGHSGDNEVWDGDTKRRMDELHLSKIDLANEVRIINPGGYIGESTANEIRYAQLQRKKITYLEMKSNA